MGAEKSGGGKGLLLILLLLIAGGAGGYNYHRNLQAELKEKGSPRFQSYSDSELEALAAAYQSEIDQYQQQVDASRGKPAAVRDGARMSDRVREFERVQATGDQFRALLGELADREGRLADIRKEQQLRGDKSAALAMHMNRLLKI